MTKRLNKLTDTQINQLPALVESGKSDTEISNKFGNVSRSAIQ